LCPTAQADVLNFIFLATYQALSTLCAAYTLQTSILVSRLLGLSQQLNLWPFLRLVLAHRFIQTFKYHAFYNDGVLILVELIVWLDVVVSNKSVQSCNRCQTDLVN